MQTFFSANISYLGTMSTSLRDALLFCFNFLGMVLKPEFIYSRIFSLFMSVNQEHPLGLFYEVYMV